MNFLDTLVFLAKHKRTILGVPAAVGVVTALISFVLPHTYTATAKILPPQQSRAAASVLLNQLGDTVGGLPGAAAGTLGIRNPNDLYVGILKSRTVADNLIVRFELNKVYGQELQSNTRNILGGMTTIVGGRDGIITIEVDDGDPKRAAALANAYVEELTKLAKVLAVTEASRRRLFFEHQLTRARENLNAAEVAAREGLETGGLANVDDQGRAMVEVTARLRAQVSVKEVQIGAMRTFATERNPELQMAQQELAALKREIARIEGSSPPPLLKEVNGGKGGLDNLGRLRDVKYHAAMYELLAKQYELAKIDEAKDATIIQVLDMAIEPDRKSKPRRSQIVLLAMLLALAASLLWAYLREVAARAKTDPGQSSRLKILRSHLRWK